jgi:hypothetical protein
LATNALVDTLAETGALGDFDGDVSAADWVNNLLNSVKHFIKTIRFYFSSYFPPVFVLGFVFLLLL